MFFFVSNIFHLFQNRSRHTASRKPFSVADGRTRRHYDISFGVWSIRVYQTFFITMCKIDSHRAPEILERTVGCFVISMGPDLSKPCNIEQKVQFVMMMSFDFKNYCQVYQICTAKCNPASLPILPLSFAHMFFFFFCEMRSQGAHCPKPSRTHNSQTL